MLQDFTKVWWKCFGFLVKDIMFIGVNAEASLLRIWKDIFEYVRGIYVLSLKDSHENIHQTKSLMD